MGFRITQRAISATALHGLQTNQQKMSTLTEQLSSGKQLTKPSDSPTKTAESMQFRSDVRRAEQHSRNADDGLSWLGLADTALTQVSDSSRRARELVVTGLNSAVMGPDSREALAKEIDQLRDHMISLANTKYLDRPIFGGNSPADAAYLADGTYQGDAGAVVRTVGPGVDVDVNVTGEAVFGADGDATQLFDVLGKLAAALREPDEATRTADLSAGLGNLDAGMDRVVQTLGTVGARFNRVEAMQKVAEDSLLTLRTSLSEVEDIDLPKTIVDLQMQEIAYKAALSATARVVQPSLLDFLR